jgi:hypothetical protein
MFGKIQRSQRLKNPIFINSVNMLKHAHILAESYHSGIATAQN